MRKIKGMDSEGEGVEHVECEGEREGVEWERDGGHGE